MRFLLITIPILVIAMAAVAFLAQYPPRAFFPDRESFQCTRTSGGNAAQIGLAIQGQEAVLTIGTERASGIASHGWKWVNGRLADGRTVEIRPDAGTGIFVNPPYATGEYRCVRTSGA